MTKAADRPPLRPGARPAPDLEDRETERQAICRRQLQGRFRREPQRRIWPRDVLRQAAPGCDDVLVVEVLRRLGFTAEWYQGERVYIRPSEHRVAYVVARHLVEVDGPEERRRKAEGRPEYGPAPESLAPIDPALPEEDRRTAPLVLATSPRVRRLLGEVVARGHARDLGAAAHAVLAAYAADLDERLRAEAGDVPAPPQPDVAAHLQLARAQPGWLGRPAQGYAALPPGGAVAAFWQGPGYLWRGRPPGAPWGFPGAFRAMATRGATLQVFDCVDRGEVAPRLPVEWGCWEWCPADGEGRMVGW